MDRNELEMPDPGTRHDVMRDAEPRRERRTIASVAIQQLDDAPGERHLAEDAAERSRFVPPVQIGERIDRVTRGMEAAFAARGGSDVTLVVEAACAHGRAGRPDRFVDHRAEAETVAALLH